MALLNAIRSPGTRACRVKAELPDDDGGSPLLYARPHDFLMRRAL